MANSTSNLGSVAENRRVCLRGVLSKAHKHKFWGIKRERRREKEKEREIERKRKRERERKTV